MSSEEGGGEGNRTGQEKMPSKNVISVETSFSVIPKIFSSPNDRQS